MLNSKETSNKHRKGRDWEPLPLGETERPGKKLFGSSCPQTQGWDSDLFAKDVTMAPLMVRFSEVRQARAGKQETTCQEP